MAEPQSPNHIGTQQPPPYDAPDRIQELESNVAALQNLVSTLQQRPPAKIPCEYTRLLEHLDVPPVEDLDDPEWIEEVLKEPGKLRLHKLQSRLSTFFMPVDIHRLLFLAWPYFEAADRRSMSALTLANIEPCRVLGISPPVALLLMLRMFPYTAKLSRIAQFVGHGDQLSMFWTPYPHAFAAKLCYDANYLVDILAPDLRSANALKEMIHHITSTFFVTLKSWSDFKINSTGKKRAKLAKRLLSIDGYEDWHHRWIMRRALKAGERDGYWISKSCSSSVKFTGDGPIHTVSREHALLHFTEYTWIGEDEYARS
ncbi:uncharacterized protein BDZ99DRAFT_493589 [Mytilinidion resinicola]|uniref:Uncharacterized protein n=1 Tax=Mytilinidion resinicola TaxID=574789 RepID=A0A6A6ZCI6_9PEZI|nr:uncharacterized protein BDZ99DRAFT_493589 [Mytilinidion resinicola]KAF2818015.1 hypothetical protein BDZ99DRAFT_493589 [Mytilinidion resinicola]